MDALDQSRRSRLTLEVGSSIVHATLRVCDLDQPAELGCPFVRYPEEWIEERAKPLLAVLDAISQALEGARITITSGYRTPEMNDALRAAGYQVAKNSRHCEGRAADITVDGFTTTEVYSSALHCHQRGIVRIGGLGLYADWVHVDIRPGGLVRWFG
jgi:uncharacterized protein YcbK (DUF882 family)